jgi:hypothetical protein
MVPAMKDDPGKELREEPGGRFAKQLANLPDKETEDASQDSAAPGRRNPDAVPPTKTEGYVTVPSVDEVARRAIVDGPQPPASELQSNPGRAKYLASS